MFYKITLQRSISVSPSELGRTLHRRLLHFLCDAVEGQPLPASEGLASIAVEYQSAAKSSAVVISVLDVLHADALQGKVMDDGSVAFRVTYAALVLKLHRGEVLDVVVETVGLDGFWGNVYGIGRIFVSQAQMSEDPRRPVWTYENDGGEGSWMNTAAGSSVKVGEVVRVRVLAETPQSQGAMAIGTMAGPYLGPL